MAAIAIVASLFGPITPVATAGEGPGCHSKACERRVEKKREVHARYAWCNTWRCVRRQDRRAARRQRTKWEQTIAPYSGWLASTRACESPTGRDSADGTYHGYYQFDLQSWAGAGGSGDPHLASMLEQSYRAVLWLKRAGRGAWPVCGV